MPNQLFSQYSSGLVQQLFFNSPIATPTGWFLALTGPPPTVGSFTELAVSNYARVSIGTGVTNWTFVHPNSGSVYNVSLVTFPTATAYWGWVSGAVLCDSVSAGAGHNQTAFFTTLSVAKEISQNDQFFVPASGMVVSLH